MKRRQVSTGNEFENRYGYCRAVRVDDRVLVAGTAPIPADGGEVPESAADQARLVLTIIVDALHAAGAEASDVVRTRMFITDPDDSEQVGLAHGEFFGEARPASTMVVVAGLLDPRWKVEIEAEAIRS